MRLAHHGRAHGAARRAAAAGLPRHAGHRPAAGPYLAIGRRLLVRPRSSSSREAGGPGMSPQDGSSFLAFHEDELRAQALAGQRAGAAAIRPFMPDQHRALLRPAALSVRRHARRARLADGLGADRRAGLHAVARSGDAAHRRLPAADDPAVAGLRGRCRDRPDRPRLHDAAAQPRQRPPDSRRRRPHGAHRPELRQLRAVHPDARARAARRAAGSDRELSAHSTTRRGR